MCEVLWRQTQLDLKGWLIIEDNSIRICHNQVSTAKKHWERMETICYTVQIQTHWEFVSSDTSSVSSCLTHNHRSPASDWQICFAGRSNLQRFSPVILIRCDRRGLADFLIAQCANKLRERAQSEWVPPLRARPPLMIFGLLAQFKVPAHLGQTGRGDGARTCCWGQNVGRQA